MSSSSSAEQLAALADPSAPTIASLLKESFDVIAKELPAAYASLVQALSQSRVRITILPEALDVWVDALVLTVEPAAPSVAPDALIDTQVATILDVLDARASLRAAVLDGRLSVTTRLERVEGLHEALLLYTHGAVRCPSFPELLERFRAWASAPSIETLAP